MTQASGSTTVNATGSGSGALDAAGSTTINAATVSGSGIAASGTAAPVEASSSTPTTTATSPSSYTKASTDAAGSTTVTAANSGTGDVNASGSTTVNGSTVAGSGVAASGTNAPVTSTTAASTGGSTATATPVKTATTTSGTSGTTSGSTAPTASSTSSSTSNANATAINDVDIYLPSGSGGTTITGNNNIVGDSNNMITGDNNSISTATTTSSAINGTAGGTTQASSSSLQEGLRNGTQVNLAGSEGSATFTPPTGHMGKGEVDRALALANRDLAAAGIANPSPQQLQVALMGGSVTSTRGETTEMPGVLQLRSQGMGWGRIAQTIGVHPAQSEQGALHSRRGDERLAGMSASQSQAFNRDGRNTLTASSPSSGSGPDLRSADSDRLRSGRPPSGLNPATGAAKASQVGAREQGERSAMAFGRSAGSSEVRGGLASGGKMRGDQGRITGQASAGPRLAERGKERGAALGASVETPAPDHGSGGGAVHGKGGKH